MDVSSRDKKCPTSEADRYGGSTRATDTPAGKSILHDHQTRTPNSVRLFDCIVIYLADVAISVIFSDSDALYI